MTGNADAVFSDRLGEKFCFGSGKSSEKEKDAIWVLLGNESDHIIGKFRPEFHMASRVSLFDAERCVEQEDSLLCCPSGQISRRGFCGITTFGETRVNLFEDIDEGGWHFDARRDGEGESHCLSGLMIGILSEENYSDCGKIHLEDPIAKLGWRINGFGGGCGLRNLRIDLLQEYSMLLEKGLPRRVDLLHIHFFCLIFQMLF